MRDASFQRINTQEKVLTMTPMKLFLLSICSVLISGVMGYKDYLEYAEDYNKFYFVIEMESSKNGISQIFFNTGQGFREQDSRRLKVTHRGFQKYSFPLPVPIESIRFDPINKSAILSIRNAGIENGMAEKLKLFPTQSFVAAKHINKMDVNEVVLTIHTEENANDPNLLIDNSSFEDKSRRIDYLTEHGWIYIGYALLIFAMFMGLGIFGQYLKRSSTHRKLLLQLSINSVVLISIYLFYVVMTIYALLVFKQFQWSEVLSVSLVFLLLLHFLLYVFHSDLFRQSLSLSAYNLLTAGLVVFFLMLLVGSPGADIDGRIFRTFPLLEMELGLGWHKDTVYHVSLIQSILNFGYPSIGQHGSPVTVYHVLSHYVDALILLTGLEPFDAYGLLYLFKKFFLLSAIIVFVSKLVTDKQFVTFLVVLILTAPIIVGSWHVIASHSLWFTSIVLILSTSKVFGLITKSDQNTFKEMVVVLILATILALGKVSTGFMFAVLLGFLFLLKQPKSYIPYLFGALFLLFLYGYSSLFSYRSSELIFSHIGIASFYKFFVKPDEAQLFDILACSYASILILISISLVYRSTANTRLLIASIFSLLVLYVVTTLISSALNSSDVWYFSYGLSSTLILFTLHSLFFNLKHSDRRNFGLINHLNRKVVFISVAILGAALTSLFYLPTISVFSMTPENVASKLDKLTISPFSNVNKSEALKNQVTFSKHSPMTLDRPWLSFRNELDAYLKLHRLEKSDVLLFVPKEIFDENIDGRIFARGMLMYAVTGVPLVYGLNELEMLYGLSDYTRAALRRHKKDFNAAEACKVGSGKVVISVQDFENPDFVSHRCSL